MIYDRSYIFHDIDPTSPPPITLIVADSGYGKTVLAEQFVKTLKLPVIQNTLHQWSAYAHSLHEQTQLLLSQVYPSIVSGTELQAESKQDAKTLAHNLKAFGGQIVYVLDNCHYINHNPTALTWLEDFIHATQSLCHLVLVGQEQPKINLVDFISSGDALIIGKKQLTLTIEDATTLARQCRMEQSLVEQLITSSEGWFAGLTPSLGQSTDEASPLSFDTYITSLLDELPEALLDFVYQSSIPEQFTLLQLEYLFPKSNIHHYFAELASTQLALSQLSDSEHYQYHELVRNLIHNRLIEQHSTRYQQLNHQFAEWFEEKELFDLAIHHYLESGDKNSAQRVMLYIVSLYERHGYTDALLSLEQQFRHHQMCIPILQLTCSTIKMSNLKFDDALESINFIYISGLKQIGFHLETKIHIRKAYIKLRQGQFEETVTILQSLEKEPRLEHPDFHITSAILVHILGQALLELARYSQSEQALLKAKQLYEQVNSQKELANSLQDLGLLYSKTGRLEQAGDALLQILSIRKQLGDPGGLAHIHNNVGSYYIQCHDYKNGQHHFKQGLEHCQQANNQRIEAYLHWNLGDLYRDLGDIALAFTHYQQALGLVSGTDPLVQCGVLNSLARFWMFQHHEQNILELLKTLKETARNHDASIYVLIANIQLHIVDPSTQQKTHDIKEQFAELCSFGNQIEVMRLIGPLLHYALTHQMTTLIKSLTNQLISYIEQNQSTQPFVVYATYHDPLHNHLLRHSHQYSDVLKAIQDLQTLQTKHYIQQNEISSTTIHFTTLQNEMIVVNHQPLTPQGFPGQRYREFVYWLYFTGAKQRSDIQLKYWSDTSRPKAQSAFTTMLHRLRQSLGDIVIRLDERYIINPDFIISSDAEQFEEIVLDTKVGRVNDVRTEDLWLQALELYPGDFLPAFDVDWVIPLREKYHQYYIDTLIGLSQCALSRQDESAIAYAKWAIREDTYNEKLYQHLMKVFSAYHRTDEIIDTYQSLTQRLQSDLDVDVSPETQQLFYALVHYR